MKKVRIHIENEFESFDCNVFVDIQLPATPREGEIIYLKDEQESELENKARKSLDVAQIYAPKWFYRKSSNCDVVKGSNLKDLSFSSAIYVSCVRYKADEDIIEVELNSRKRGIRLKGFLEQHG